MQTTYHIKGREIDTFINNIRKRVQDDEELTITITSKNKIQPSIPTEDTQEDLFKSLFGSWEGDETGDELIKQIYSARTSSTRNIEL